MKPLRSLLEISLLVAVASPAFALSQPNGAPIPAAPGCSGGKPDGLAAVFACQCLAPAAAGTCNIGAPCPSMTTCDNGQHATCETTLWHNFNDNTCLPSNLSGLDPVADATLTPDTFHPTCGLTFTVATRGSARFQNAFGWYNVTGAQPAASDLHVIIDCNAAVGSNVVLDVKNDPSYLGGDIGFFLLTPEDHNTHGSCASNNCCPTVARVSAGEGYAYYSQRQFNPDNGGTNPFIHLVIYNSTIVMRKFYFAWEDTFDTTSANFTDLVTSVDGVECSGGGTTCDTGKGGVCANGVNQCAKGVLTCIDLYQPQPEICDGLDNNCNGIVDDGATCPDPSEVCQNGECVPHCAQSSEFACGQQMTCDPTTGLCNDPACAGVSCPADKVCRGGQCVGACDGIVCPHGTVCRLGSCIDPCRNVTCMMGDVCAEGLCVPGCNQCGGLTCASGDQCDPTAGTCFDPTCPSGCPTGTFCNQGTCTDSCTGAVCPSGHVCVAGECMLPGANNLGSSDGGTGGGGSSDGGVGSGGPGDTTQVAAAGCGCSARATNAKSAWLFALLLLGGLLRRRR